MGRALLIAAIALGCSSDPGVVAMPPSPPPQFDSGPPRVCGVEPGSACEGEGEITRCLCGRFEDQIGRFVCCRGGQAVALECQPARSARDCDGNLASPLDASAAD